MKKLDATEKAVEKDSARAKEEVLDFLKRLRAITEKKEEGVEVLPLWKRLRKPLIPLWKDGE